MPVGYLDHHVCRSRKVLNASTPQTQNEFMSEQAIESDNLDAVGQTSAESSEESTQETKSLLASFNIYNGMMLVSMICITLAIVLMFVELNQFGNIFSGEFPWRTSDQIINP